jgi:hypothetical protein
MNIDDLLARHRPDARMTPEQRTDLLAALDVPTVGVTLLDPGERPVRSASHRRAWMPAAATVATVLVCAGGLAAWRAVGRAGDGTSAGGAAAAAVCAGTLPAGWSAARLDVPLRVEGNDAVPQATAPDGDLLVSWSSTPTMIEFGLRAPDGAVTRVASFAQDGNRGVGVGGTDGKYAVFTSSPDASSAPNDIVLVDIASHTRMHLLPAAPAPAGWVVRSDPALQDGYVYWGMTPPNDDSHGIVIRYAIATHSYRVLARLDRFPEVISDVRGVAWPGDAEYRTGLPAALNPLLDQTGAPVDRLVTDGRTYAWQMINGDQSVFHWADSSGNTRAFRLSLGEGHDGAAVTAVSGPFLFFHVNKSSHTESVLDTRTGALAPAGLDETVWSYAGGQLFAQTSGFEYHEVKTSDLPGIDCS